MTSRIWVITMFPEYYKPLLETGVVGQALSGKRGKDFEFRTIYLPDHSPADFKGVDEAPYGGGQGMVMRADVLKNALMDGVVKAGDYGENWREKLHIVYPSPRGGKWNNKRARDYGKMIEEKDLVFVCGRYEGIDERFIENYIDEQLSLGDFVLSSGDVATMAMIDSALRFVPGVLGNKVSCEDESFEKGLLEGPLYTRPPEFEGKSVPEVLMSGHHGNIEKYREREKLRITREHRPDLLEGTRE